MDLKQNRVNNIEHKIGRNLLLLQKIEYLLKYIVTHANLSAPANKFKEIAKQKEDNIKGQTMGIVLSQFLAHMNTTSDNDIEDSDLEENSVHVSFDIQFNYNEVELERKKIMLTEILKERNYLVHHLIIDFDEDSHESCQSIENKLDKQRDKILVELNDLQSTAKSIRQLKKESFYHILANYFPLLFEFVKISIKKQREDGWTSLGIAGKVIRQTLPNEISQLKHKTLKSYLLSTLFFDIKEDVSKNMILFRLKPGFREYFEQYCKE